MGATRQTDTGGNGTHFMGPGSLWPSRRLESRPVHARPWRSRHWLAWLATLATLALALAAAFHHATTISIADATVRLADGSTRPVVFPYRADDAPPNAVLEFSFTIHKGPLTQRRIVFVPDDSFRSLTVNGHDVPLGGVAPGGLDDIGRGFSFPIGPYLQRGDNLVVARVLNRGGPGGLDARPDIHDARNVLGFVGGACAFLVLVAVALRRLGWRWSVVAPFSAGVALRLAYLFVTPSSTRAQDVEGHLDYIQYLLEHHALPRPYDGWSFYQPPLYYITGAGLWGALRACGVASRDTILFALQAQSLLYQLLFLVFSLRTIDLWMDRVPEAGFGRRIGSRGAVRALAAALLCSWPSGVIHSVRIGNDDLLYMCFGASVYFASRWWITDRSRDFNLAALWGALAILTKSNGLVVFVALGILLAVRVGTDPQRRLGAYVRRVWPSAALFVLATAASLGRAAVDTASGRRSNLLVGNAGRLSDTLAVGNGAVNYLWFDTKIFATQPFLGSYDDAQGRQFFWNAALKTSLFGLFSFDQAHLADLAAVVSFFFLAMLVHFTVGIANTERQGWLADLPALVLVTTLVASLAALRISIPMACSCDFRYILPALAPFAYLYVRGLARFRELGWTRWSRTGASVGWSFVVASMLFFGVLAVEG